MVQIPTSRDVAYTGTRSGRISPSGPSVSVGAAVANAGQNIVQAAYDLNDLRTSEQNDLQAKAGFDLETKITQFRDAEEQAFNKAKEESNESGIGFTRQFIEGYQGRVNNLIKENFGGLTESQNAQARQSLLGLGNSLYGKSYAYEQQAKTNFYDRTTNSGLDTIRTQIRNNAAPYEELKKQGLAAIDTANMPEPWKAERRALWDADAAESKWRWKFEQDPKDAVREMRGIKVDTTGLSNAIKQTSEQLGISPNDLATVMSYETGGTFDPWKKGPTTQWGTHRGLIQWGEPQARKYGVTEDTPVEQQVAAAGQYLKDAGVTPGMGLLDIYSAINAGKVGRYNASDASNGGAPGTVRDKVEQQMESHKAKAAALLGGTFEAPSSDPDIDAIPYDRREQLAAWGEGQYNQQRNQQAAVMRGQIEVAAENAPSAIQNTGSYSGVMPTSEQFMQAYGPQEGSQRYNKLMAAVETSQQAYKMQTMPVDDIQAIVAAAKPTASGDTAALDAARYETLSSAAQATIKAREADPSTYVQKSFPHVAQAWQDAGTSGDYRTALTMTAAAQQQLGVRNMQLMPKALADQTVTNFKDENKTGAERVAAVTGLVFATGDPNQRRAIFEQLVKAGLPDTTEGAIEAYARGDEGAGRRLMEAAIIDPSKLPGSSPFKPADIDAAIQSQIMDEGQVGDIVYGLSDGTIENQETAIRDAKLLTNAVNIRVRNGEALDLAVQSAAKDLYGDIQAVAGNWDVNAQIVLPAGTDPAPVLDGLAGLLPTVRTRLEASVVAPPEVGTADGGKAILQGVRSNYIDNVMAEGYFRNSGDGYVFIDPFVGAAVTGPDGKPMMFSIDQVSSATPAAEMGPMDMEAEQHTIQRTQQEIEEETYGEFAPLLDDLRKDEAPVSKPKTFNPGPITGSGGGGY